MKKTQSSRHAKFPASLFRKKPNKRPGLVKRLWNDYIAVYKFRMVAALACMAVAAVSQAIQVQLLVPTIDQAMNEVTFLLILIPLAYFLLAITKGIAVWIQASLTAVAGGHIVAAIQKTMFKRLLNIDINHVFQVGSGTLVARFTYDLLLLRDAFTRSLVAIVKECLLLLAYLGLMLYHNLQLTLIVLVAYPLIAVPLYRVAGRLRSMGKQHQEQTGHVAHLVTDCLRCLRTILTFNASSKISQKAEHAFEQSRVINTKTQIIRASITPVNEILGGLTIAMLIGFGGWQVASGAMTSGQFTAFIAALILSYQPIRSLSSHNTHIQEGLAAIERLYDLLDQPDRTVDKPGAPAFVFKRGYIEFVDVSVATPGNKTAQLRNLSFYIEPGQHLAIFGISGAGKTSLINSLLRFIPVTKGKILIDGQDIANVQITTLRQHFALVAQDANLIHGTPRENIMLSEPNDSLIHLQNILPESAPGHFNRLLDRLVHPPDSPPQHDQASPLTVTPKLQQALRLAEADNFLLQPHNRLDASIGEGALALSGGQQQRVAIARAFYSDAKIFLLDEPSSALDDKNEAKVLTNLFKRLKNRTVIYITHKPANLKFADRIIILQAGKMVTSGSYRKLVNNYF